VVAAEHLLALGNRAPDDALPLDDNLIVGITPYRRNQSGKLRGLANLLLTEQAVRGKMPLELA
jgi:hypothetical protein